MKLLGADITDVVYVFLRGNINISDSNENINDLFRDTCGINAFFETKESVDILLQGLNSIDTSIACEPQVEYGDFQTNEWLANKITDKLSKCGKNPDIIIEPTCGKGNFIIAALNTFKSIKKIFGVEIQEKYVWQTKFNILNFYLNNPSTLKPEINIIHSSIFNFNFNSIKDIIGEQELLIIGNPPWVTNSELSSIDSKNLPNKSNFKHYKGFDAITGKSNFDIAEYITLILLKIFDGYKGSIAFLVKNTVIRNIVQEQIKTKLHISEIKKQNIDCKKEFDVSVDAALFMCEFSDTPDYICQETNFYTDEHKCNFGWRNNKFMSNLSFENDEIDGSSPLEWRQGVKHDCSKVMELSYNGFLYSNKLGEKFQLEHDLIFPLLKSSDLKEKQVSLVKKYVIVTQSFVGQNTDYIKEYPLTYNYLTDHIELFRKRKSSIYKGKCDFSIFGIGDYSFKPYKIAISGLYKTFHFTLVKPQNNRPVMLDDTCYFIGFDDLKQAEIIWKLLNTEMVADFLKNISFPDSKRMITKDILMRIDLRKLAELNGEIIDFVSESKEKCTQQLLLFE